MSSEPSAMESTDLSPPESKRRVRMPVFLANAADHALLARFLAEICCDFTPAVFQTLLEEPTYQPRNRLLLRRGQQIVAHALLTERQMQFGQQTLPIAGLHHLCVAAEARGQGLGSHLLAAAEREMAVRGAMIGVLRTRNPLFFRHTGWALCGRHDHSRADARRLIAHLEDPPADPDYARSLAHCLSSEVLPPLHIRPWRQWELGAIRRIYEQNLPGMRGPTIRSAAQWQWLLSRSPQDEVLVALEGPEQLEIDEQNTRIVGYCVRRGDRLLELMAANDSPRAALALLHRTCADAIEYDRAAVLLHAPPGSPLHRRFQAAGGQTLHSEADHGAVYMARLLDPVGLLRRMAGELRQRAEESGAARPLDLGLLVDGRKIQLEFRDEGVEVFEDRLGRSHLRLSGPDFTRLILGRLDFAAAVSANRIEPSTAIAHTAAAALFPPLPLWHPPFEELPP